MKQPGTRALFDYWNQVRGGRAAPERADIDPVAIRGLLSDTFVVEVDRCEEEPCFPIRLSGTRINALFLDELKGRSLAALWDPVDQIELRQALSYVVDDAAPVVIGLQGAPAAHAPLNLECLLLPLRHQGRTHARLLGSIVPSHVPSWLGLRSIEHFWIRSMRLIDDADLVLPHAIPAQTHSETTGPKRYGHFMVHDGGR